MYTLTDFNKENYKNVINNLIEISKKYLNSIDENQIIFDIYYYSKKEEVKEYLIDLIKDIKNYDNQIINVFKDIIKTQKKEKFFEIFSDYLNNNSNYYLLDENDEEINDILKQFEIKTKNASKLYFYLSFNNKNMINNDLKKIEEISKKFNNEKENTLMNNLLNKNYKDIFNFDYNLLEYGEKGNEKIMNYIKQMCLIIVFNEFYNSNVEKIKIDDLDKKLNIEFDDYENAIFDGNNNKFFVTKIDNDNNVINLIYIKLINFTQENIDKIKKDVGKLQEKFKILITAFDKI
jgi:hypothetical protein